MGTSASISRTSFRSSSAFTLIELLVVIAIIAILAAILFPVFAQAREKARQASCQSNQKQIGIAVIQYYQDFDGAYPPRYIDYDVTGTVRKQWPELLFPYIKQKGGASSDTTAYSQGVWDCPSNTATSTNNRNPSYAMMCDSSWQTPFNSASPNADWKGFVWHGIDNSLYDPMVTAPADTLMIGETQAAWHRICPANNLPAGTPAAAALTRHYNTPGWTSHYAHNTNKADVRHNGGSNYIFFDGHVKWMRSEQALAPKNMWTLYDLD